LNKNKLIRIELDWQSEIGNNNHNDALDWVVGFSFQKILFSAAAHCRGFTALVHKVDALLYALALEVNTGDRQQSIRQYGHRVISCLSDQGAFSELFGTFW